MKKLLLAALLLFTTLQVSATGPVFIDGVDNPIKTSTCTLPFERTDGTPMTIAEIQSVELYVLPDLMDPDPMPTYVDSSLLCSGDIDMTQLAYGQWYLFWKTTDTDGLLSSRSPTVPFVWRGQNAPPNAPSNPTLQ